MGTKYSSVSVSGYNASPPADDGTVSEANKVKYSTVKTKLSDPLNTFASSVDSALTTHFNNGPQAYTSNQTLGASHYGQIIQVSGSSVTLTLSDAATLGAGWFCDIYNTDASNDVTLGRATGGDTLNGSAANGTLRAGQHCRVYVIAAATGFLTVWDAINAKEWDGAAIFNGDVDLESTVSPGGTALLDGATVAGGVASGAVVAWVPRGYIAGLLTSSDTDTDHDINITAGEAADSTSVSILKLTTEMTKQIDAAFVAGDDAGGMFTGSVANDTWYYVHLIRKDSDGSIDAGFDTSATAANIPSGYTYYRRIGAVLTDGSANIIAFHQVGNTFWWDAFSAWDLSTATETLQTVTASAPAVDNIIGHIFVGLQNFHATNGGGGSVVLSSPRFSAGWLADPTASQPMTFEVQSIAPTSGDDNEGSGPFPVALSATGTYYADYIESGSGDVRMNVWCGGWTDLSITGAGI